MAAPAPAVEAPAPAEGEEEVLVDFEEEPEEPAGGEAREKKIKSDIVKKGSYSGLHHTGFRDFLLKSELLMAITDCGFEHPSEVQQETIPNAVLGMDIICQAKSGMGKTAVFVLATLQQMTLLRDKWILSFCAIQENWRIKYAKSFFASASTYVTLM